LEAPTIAPVVYSAARSKCASGKIFAFAGVTFIFPNDVVKNEEAQASAAAWWANIRATNCFTELSVGASTPVQRGLGGRPHRWRGSCLSS
jgi:hypothetical protein